MNPSDTKKSTCRSRESLKRRRKQRKQEIKRDTSATGSCGGQKEQANLQVDIERMSKKNEELDWRLDIKIKKRKSLQMENLDLHRKLDKMHNTKCPIRNHAGTYIGQVHRVIESSKIHDYAKDPSNNMIRRIDASNLTTQDKTSSVLGEGSFGFVKKMMYRGVEVAVKVLKGDANERHLLHEATVRQEIGDHPGVPFWYGICIKEHHLMLVTQCCCQDGKVLTLSDAVNTLELSKSCWWQIILKLTEVLMFIHMKGFIHNDLKGKNVLLTRKEQIWQPVIIDYGKCIKASEAKPRKLSTSLSRKTFSYTAPEVHSGKYPPSPASDIFSLGVILEKMNSKLPFTVVPKDVIASCCHENPSLRIKNALLLGKLTHCFKN